MNPLLHLFVFCFSATISIWALAAADRPEPRQKNFSWMPLHAWYQYHAEDVQQAYEKETDLLFLGDSITQGWDQALWQKYFAPYNALNFGIGGDLTQHLLWRLQNGATGYLQPRLVVLMIGVNNFGHEDASAKEVADGVEAIVREIKPRFPLANVLLLGILPFEGKNKAEDREHVREANVLLAKLADKHKLMFRDYGDLFLQADGSVSKNLMPDLLHPNAQGYALLAEQLQPLIKEALPANPVVTTQDARILVEGRAHTTANKQLQIGYPGVSLHLSYSGRALSMLASSTTGNNLLDVYIDGKLSNTLEIAKIKHEYVLVHDEDAAKHKVELVHRSETWHGVLNIEGFRLHDGELSSDVSLPERKILFIGDSITCGEALLREKKCDKKFSWWDPEHSYGKLLGEALNAQTHLVCYGGRGLLRSWNGNTSEAQAPDFFHSSVALENNPPLWDHSSYTPDLVFINLGTNDFNLNIGPFPEKEVFITRYLEFIRDIQKVHPDAMILITGGPMVNDESDPQRAQKTVLRSYLKEVQQRSAGKVVYLTSAVYPGDACDAHPTAKEHQKIAEDFTTPLLKLMNW